MEIEGKIIVVLPKQSGISARTGSPWESQEFVIETHEQYPRKCCFRVFGADRLAQMNIQSGQELRVSFDIDAHEYNGRWFNNISAWRVEPLPVGGVPGMDAQQPGGDVILPTASPASGAPVSDAPFPPAPENADCGSQDDLPF